jgi:hypothetical protein
MFSGWMREGSDGPWGILAAAGASRSRPSEPSDPEYTSLRASIDAVVSCLDEALTHVHAVEKAWAGIARGQAALCVTVATGGGVLTPRKTEGALAAKAFGQAVARNTEIGQMTHLHAYEQVRRYLEHLRGIQQRFADVVKAKAAYEVLVRKVRAIEGRNQANTSPNLSEIREGKERARAMYFAMLSRVIERMRTAVERRSVALDLVQHAFWLQQSAFHRAMASAETTVMDTARATEPVVVSTTLMEGLSAPESMFSSLRLHSASADSMSQDISSRRRRAIGEQDPGCSSSSVP